MYTVNKNGVVEEIVIGCRIGKFFGIYQVGMQLEKIRYVTVDKLYEDRIEAIKASGKWTK